MVNNNLIHENLQKLDLKILESSYEGLPKAMIRQALTSYLAEAAEFISHIGAAPQPDTAQVILCFHNLKTMSGMIGALDIVMLCKNYENSSTEQEKVELIGQLALEWTSLKVELQQLLQNGRF
jgi:HPt (histidine-containing phosphotransfer) domain-containing protein